MLNRLQVVAVGARGARGPAGERAGLLGGVAQHARARRRHAPHVPPRVVRTTPRAARALPGSGLRDTPARRRAAAQVNPDKPASLAIWHLRYANKIEVERNSKTYKSEKWSRYLAKLVPLPRTF